MVVLFLAQNIEITKLKTALLKNKIIISFVKLVVDDTEKAEMLNIYFTGVSTIDDGILRHLSRRLG